MASIFPWEIRLSDLPLSPQTPSCVAWRCPVLLLDPHPAFFPSFRHSPFPRTMAIRHSKATRQFLLLPFQLSPALSQLCPMVPEFLNLAETVTCHHTFPRGKSPWPVLS